jgi:hypothetical protein
MIQPVTIEKHMHEKHVPLIHEKHVDVVNESHVPIVTETHQQVQNIETRREVVDTSQNQPILQQSYS